MLRDPRIEVRNLRGQVLGNRQFNSLDAAKAYGHDLVRNGGEDAVDIVEIFEQRLAGFTVRVEREVMADD